MLKNRCYAVAVAKRENDGEFNPAKFDFSYIPNGLNYWVADPFPIEVNNELYIFGEIYEYASLKGSIAYTKKTSSGFTKWKKIIEEPYHLSFPNVFYIGDELYMCPESHANRSLQIYKCVDFPEKWILDRVIMDDEDCVDTVFCDNREDSIIGLTCEWHSLKDHFLRLFKINKTTGQYEFSKEKIEPIDKQITRSAGNVIEVGNKVYSVSQICEPLYGSGLMFKDIDISFPKYTEKELYRVYPNQITSNLKRKLDGIHTFNLTENYVVVDLIWSRLNLIEKFYRFVNKIRREAR